MDEGCRLSTLGSAPLSSLNHCGSQLNFKLHNFYSLGWCKRQRKHTETFNCRWVESVTRTTRMIDFSLSWVCFTPTPLTYTQFIFFV